MKVSAAVLSIFLVITQACSSAPAATATAEPTLASPIPTSTPAPTGPSVLNQIAFTTDRDGNFEIYRMNADGTQPINLTNNPAYDSRPAWSPDGQRIVFESDRDLDSSFPPANIEIYMMNADGSGVVRLTNNTVQDYNPVWSPDGTMVAFGEGYGDVNEIYLINVDGTVLTRMPNSSTGDYDLSWSPDSTRVAFASNRDITDPADGNEIYVMNVDGSGLTRLTFNTDFDGHPIWSADGTRIAYESCCETMSSEIYVMNTDGSNQIDLTNLPSQEELGSWSPDNQHLVFYSDMDLFNPEIYIIDLLSGEITRITTNEAVDQDPVWSTN